MQEPLLPATKVLAYSLWTWTGALVVAAWATYPTSHDLAIMLATCACVCGLGASTASIRWYALRIVRLIRITRQDGRIRPVD